MYELTVPFVERIHPVDGLPFWTPNVPAEWKWEQASSLLDTGPNASSTRLSVLSCYEKARTIEDWMDQQPSSNLIRSQQYDAQERVAYLTRGRGRSAMKEWRAARDEKKMSPIRGRERAEIARRAARMLFPFAVGYALGGEEAAALALLVMSETLTTGTDLDDFHGRSPDTVDLHSATWDVVGAYNGVGVDGAGVISIGLTGTSVEFIQREGTDAARYYGAVYAGDPITDGYIVLKVGDMTSGRSGLRSRWGTAAYTGYAPNGLGNGDMWRYDSQTSRSAVGSANSFWQASYSRSVSAKMEFIGSDITLYGDNNSVLAQDEEPSTADGTASDSTYASGLFGVEVYNGMGIGNGNLGNTGALEIHEIPSAPRNQHLPRTPNCINPIMQLIKNRRV